MTKLLSARPSSDILAHRSESLALVALTRRKDVQPIRFDVGEVDFLVRLAGTTGEREQFRCLGIAVKGTENAVASTGKASVLANSMFRVRGANPSGFYFPVLALLFTMENDKGYYAWMMQPGIDEAQEEPKLWKKSKLNCGLFTDDACDEIIESVRDWYDLVERKMVVGSGD